MHLRDLFQTPYNNGLVKVLPRPIRAYLQQVDHRRRSSQVAYEQDLLRQIISEYNGVSPQIIFPPGLSWGKQLFQRPQQIAVSLARHGALVFYMEEPLTHNSTPFQKVEERLFLCRVPIETFWVMNTPVVYTLTWMLSKYWMAIDTPRLVYDYVDNLDTFVGNRFELRRSHDRLLKRADVVLVTAQRLKSQVKDQRPDAVYCPNGCDYRHFVQARQPCSATPPDDIAAILALGKPVIGYYGALANWFDADLLQRVAYQKPDFSFVLVGPDHEDFLRSSTLLAQPNIYWLGAKPYQQLPDYLRCFDVAMIPFKLNEITHATSPVKLFEYMAAEKPVVITPMQESMQYPGVLVGANAIEFTTQIIEALKLKQSPAYLELLDQTALANTWDMRGLQILKILRNLA
jgi:glycosyltransferase involved in cell wall biosynthesis